MTQRRKLSKEKRIELYKSVAPIANKFRYDFLDDYPINNSFQTLESLGFFIIRFPTHNDLSGFHIEKSNYHCVFINSSHSLGRQYFSAWHECYHAYTGDRGGISLMGDANYDEMEQKADYFASCILMPEDIVQNYLKKNGITNLRYMSYVDIIKMQNFFRVSYSALLMRLIQLFPEYQKVLGSRFHLGSPKNKKKMLEKIIEAGVNSDLIEPTNDLTISSSFYENIYDNLEQDRITAEKAQSIIDLIEGIKSKYER